MKIVTLSDTTSEASHRHHLFTDLMYAIVLSIYLKPAPNDNADVTPPMVYKKYDN